MSVPISVSISMLDGNAPLSNYSAVLFGAVDCIAQLHQKSRASHFQEAQAGPPGCECQVFVDVTASMDYFQVFINEDRGWGVIRKKAAIKLFLSFRKTRHRIRKLRGYPERAVFSGH